MWDKYTISDEQWLTEFGGKKYYNNYLDEDKNKYLQTTTVKECIICGGRLSRNFRSQTCGHGESVESITYICENCDYEDTQHYGMGTPIEMCDVNYCSKAVSLVTTILNRTFKEKEKNENLH